MRTPSNFPKSQRPAGGPVMTRRELLEIASAFGLALLTNAGCGTEEETPSETPPAETPTDEPPCEPRSTDINEELTNKRPSITITPNTRESDGTNYRVEFEVPDFDPTYLPEFEQNCRKWPLHVRVRAVVVATSDDAEAQSWPETQVLGHQVVDHPGPSFIDFTLLQTNPDGERDNATRRLTSYSLELYAEVPGENGNSEPFVVASSDPERVADFSVGVPGLPEEE